jgi:8-oxo-dGTP pyrophosphatase MutT (NUDIX family)
MADEPEPRQVVTCFLRRKDAKGKDEILILRRSRRVGSYQGRWAGVSGYLEGDEPVTRALVEIEEETGLRPAEVRLVQAGEPLLVDDEERGLLWLVHPFLFDVATEKPVTLDWENTEARWIAPAELVEYETVPLLKEALGRVYIGPDRA